MMHHARIAQRAFNTPLMVEPSKALAFLSGLGPRIAGQEITFHGAGLAEVDVAHAILPAHASLIGGGIAEGQRNNDTQLFTLTDGIALIEIAGTLVHRGAWIGQSSGLTSYEGIAAQIDAAIADPAVRSIALEIDSFGGEVAGAFDLADRIRAARDQKPVHAFVAEHALSAGYALASQADHVTLPRTGAVGSIGVVTLHTEMSGMLEQKGVTVTLVHAGAHKTDANPYEPLPPDVRTRMQAELEGLRTLFAQTVAAGRGNRLDVHAALDTEAAVLRGSEAVAAGLADAVVDPRAAFQAFADSIHHRANLSKPRKGTSMNTTTDPTDEADTKAPIAQAEAMQAPIPVADTPQPQQSDPIVPAAAAPDANAIRAEAAEVAQVCAQAARLGVQIDAADAVKRGLKPEALRAQVLEDLAARGDAAALIWSNAPEILNAHDRGALIRSKSGFWLAIPTEAAGKGRGGARLTPAQWERRRGIRLRFIYRRNGPSLLVAEKARINTRGLAVASRSKTGRGQVSAPIFLLVRQVKLRKRLDLARDAEKVAGAVPGLIVEKWVEGR